MGIFNGYKQEIEAREKAIEDYGSSTIEHGKCLTRNQKTIEN